MIWYSIDRAKLGKTPTNHVYHMIWYSIYRAKLGKTPTNHVYHMWHAFFVN